MKAWRSCRRHGRGQVGDDRARRDGVDANALRCRFPCQRAREPHDRRLGRGIGRRVHRALQAALRGDVDDAALSARHHRRIDRLGHEEHALEVHVDDPVELLLGEGLERLADVDAGIVEQDVDRPELARRLGGEGPPGGDVGDVDRAVQGAPAERADLAGGLVGLGPVVEMAKGDVRALGREGQRRGAADAARAAGDQSDFSREFHAFSPVSDHVATDAQQPEKDGERAGSKRARNGLRRRIGSGRSWPIAFHPSRQ